MPLCQGSKKRMHVNPARLAPLLCHKGRLNQMLLVSAGRLYISDTNLQLTYVDRPFVNSNRLKAWKAPKIRLVDVDLFVHCLHLLV